MKRCSVFICLFLSLVATSPAQVVSDCNVPPLLQQHYSRDFANLAMRAMWMANSPDTALVHIPPYWLDQAGGGMAAIFNATSIPQRDSIFDRYCVHDWTSSVQTYEGYLMEVDTYYAWTQAWRNLVTLTGNAPLDSMLVRYDLQVTQFFNWSIGSFALLETDSLWNNRALIDSLETIPGIFYGEPNAIFGAAGRIALHIAGNERYYDFYFEFNDCFDGCDNFRRWQFRVNPDCSVDYLGFVDWGYFGIEPLPAPLDCNISTSLPHVMELGYIAFPNPATSLLHVQGLPMTPCTVSLYDVQGRKVQQTQVDQGKLSWEVAHLPRGMYLLEVQTLGQISSLRIALQ